EAYDRINRERVSTPGLAVSESRIFFARRAEHMIGGHQAEKHPHAEQTKPGEELHHGKLLHRRRHLTQSVRDLRNRSPDALALLTLAIELLEVLWRKFSGRYHCPKHAEQKSNCTNLERITDARWNDRPGSAGGTVIHMQAPKNVR